MGIAFQNRILNGVIVASALCFQIGSVMGDTPMPGPTPPPTGTPKPPLVIAIYKTGSKFPPDGGADTYGKAYVASELGSSVDFNGSHFTFGQPNSPDVYCSRVVSLPSGNYTTLNMLAASTGGLEPPETFTVNYVDGTHSSFTINMSDWADYREFQGEILVKAVPHYANCDGTLVARQHYVFGYTFNLLGGRIPKSITLPPVRGVIVFGFSPRY